MPPRPQNPPSGVGYVFKLPLLGLTNPASTYVPLRVAIGDPEASKLLLLKPATPAPLRPTPQSEYDLVEIEYGGFVWFLPSLGPKTSLQGPEIFTVNARVVPVTEMPPNNERDKITAPMRAICFGKFYQPGAYGRLPWTTLPTSKEASLEQSVVFDLCLDPSPAQCQPPTPYAPNAEPDHAAEARWCQERDKAWKRWAAFSVEAVNEEWLREVYRGAVAAGLRKSVIFKKNKPLVRLRAQDPVDYDVRSLEYAICQKGGKYEVAEDAVWKPLPAHAYSQDFVRCTINLLRREAGKGLFAKGS